MNERIDQTQREIAALYALLDKKERSTSEQYKVDNFERELAHLEDYRKTLVTALARTQDSSNDEHMADPSSSHSSLDKEAHIDIHEEHLKRPELVAKLTHLIAENRFVTITAPPGSGKSSLLKLYQKTLKNTNVIWINCVSDTPCFELLAKRGIDLQNCKYGQSIGKRNTVVFLDDAQAKYTEVRFWEQLIKASPNWLPSNVRFIISATFLFSGGRFSSVEFNALPKIDRNDFLLTEKESDEFLELPTIGLPQRMKTETVKQVIIQECGGLIACIC